MNDSLDANYDITLSEKDDLANVEDDASSEQSISEKFTITSYGADFPVDGLVKRVKNKSFFVPPFQRLFIWNARQASRFIESLLLGLPVPGIFVFREGEEGKHLIIDGQQRLKSLEAFYKNNLRDKAFRLVDVRDPWNGKTYEELDEGDRQRLDDSIVHTTVFRQDDPDDGGQSVYEVFERINSGGMKLSAQEIRSCVNFGPFTDLLTQLNENKSWRAIYGKESSRLKDHELILRYLALEATYDKYQKPLGNYLNSFMAKSRSMSNDVAEKYRKNWSQTINFCKDAFGTKAFRPERALNTAVFDAITVGVSRRLQLDTLPPSAASALSVYDTLLSNPLFREYYNRATSDEISVKGRIKMSIEAFAKI